MANLLHQTLATLARMDETPAEIMFIGSEATNHQCTWDEFCVLADKDYDNGFGIEEVATDLVIICRSGARMWRNSYDGSEWWEFSKPFDQPKVERKPITSLFRNGYGGCNLQDCCEDAENES